MMRSDRFPFLPRPTRRVGITLLALIGAASIVPQVIAVTTNHAAGSPTIVALPRPSLPAGRVPAVPVHAAPRGWALRPTQPVAGRPAARATSNAATTRSAAGSRRVITLALGGSSSKMAFAIHAPTDASLSSDGELSLQETLDRLGYSVNVPVNHDGEPLTQPRPYRTSTQDDAVDAETFVGNGRSGRTTFRTVSQQAMLAGTTEFGVLDGKQARTLLRAPAPGYGLWLDNQNGPATSLSLPGSQSVGFFLRDRSNAFRTGALTSRAADNANHGSQLLVLPAQTGGTWVDEGNDTGHWEGGESHGYLLCWEDSPRWDSDYQDMVVLVQNVQPVPNQ